MLKLLVTLTLFLLSNGVVRLTTTKPKTIPDVPDYWPDLDNDLTKVIWSHATNSLVELEVALTGDVMMIEADVSLGTLVGHPDQAPLPIMAHPPADTSDLSLQMFLDMVVQAVSTGTIKKGIKLDFKSIEVVEPSLKILQKQQDLIKFPLWLNADILEGPHGVRKPVDSDQFLALCSKYFPDAAISPGYTTGSTGPDGMYTVEQAEAMIGVIKKHEYVGRKITYPVRNDLTANSYDSLIQLLDETSTPNVKSTLTIWGSNLTDAQKLKLKEVVERVGRNRVYWDVPFPLDS